jgi:ribosomal protein S18 acetylase RimI-like enzyme
MIYRRPTPDEAETMAALHVQCWREAYVGIVPDHLMATFEVKQRIPMWQKSLGDATRIVFAAYDTEKPVGFVMAGQPVEHMFGGEDGHIAAIYIAASHHRLGIGRKLIGLAAKAWSVRGGHSLALGVLAENVSARSFYESLGARLVRTGTYDWDGYSLNDVIYVFENLPLLTP